MIPNLWTGSVPVPLPPVEDTRIERNSVALIDLADPTHPRLDRYVRIAPSQRPDNRNIVGTSHPSAMALSPDGSLLYVTATNVDLLIAVDTETFRAVAEIPLNVFEEGPTRDRLQGLYPNALAVAPDGSRVYIADAGINIDALYVLRSNAEGIELAVSIDEPERSMPNLPITGGVLTV